jgi:tRNA A37 threonylcarbamoyladenosine synthetase subunit TsaC/SUA5/YrdC
VPRTLCAEVGPLATTSANLHGEATPPTADEVQGLFGDAVAVVVDGGRCEGEPSTVVDCTGAMPKLVREGTVSWSDVLGVVG